MGAGVAVAAVVVGGASFVLDPSISGAGPDSTPGQGVAGTQLITEGECADLVITAQWQRTGGAIVVIGPDPAANRVTMSANSLLYLRATGSCVDRLRFRTESALVQGATSPRGGTFNEEGISPVISHPGTGGSAVLELYVRCDDGTLCVDGDRPLAELTIEITPSDPPSTAPVSEEELVIADWTLASQPAPTDTVLQLEVVERSCASGQSADGRIVAETALHGDRDPGDRVCPGPARQPRLSRQPADPVRDRADRAGRGSRDPAQRRLLIADTRETRALRELQLSQGTVSACKRDHSGFSRPGPAPARRRDHWLDRVGPGDGA